MSKRSRILSFGSAAVLVVAGVAGGVGFGGTFGQVLAFVLISLGLVLATALVFYEVGLSEDRERAREQARRTREKERRRDDVDQRDAPPGARLRMGRLERRRGERRRLM